MSTQTFNLSLDKELVVQLDAQAKKDFSSRSDYVRKAVLNQLKQDVPVGNPVIAHGNATEDEVLTAAKKILKDYRRDFKDLALR